MKIVKASLETQVSSMYKDYAISVIKERAIPNVIDGLKPVARKALYTMFEMGLDHKAPRRKVNTIGGATLKYSVHGNVSVEGAINVMASSIKTNIPLIDGQGNFGSQMGDPAAASRYCCTGDVKVITKTMGEMTHEQLAKLGGEPDEEGYIDLSHLNLEVVGGFEGKWVKCHKMVDSGIHTIYKIELENGKVLTCSRNHPIYISNLYSKGWCQAERLTAGNIAYVINDDGTFNEVMIKSITILEEKERVYSLVIDDPSHAYITNGILSHNTEARLSEYTCRMYFDDLFKYTKTIDWELNYDDTLYEPCYLPAKLPNLLINGCARGVAVGYTAAHVPHNPIDVINATVAYISNRDISTDDLIKIIKGPDFPTGGVINGMESVYRAYTTGKGSVLLRGKYKITEDRGYQTVSIFELPFGISTPTILEQIAKLADDNKVKLVKGSLHDHSDMNGVNIEFSIKKEEDVDRVMNCILKETDLETRIPISAYVIDGNNNLKLCTLKDIISEFISAREDMLHRKFKEEIEDRNKRIHLLNGLVIINKDMDNAISIIRKSKGKQDAKEKLMKKYGLDEEQANYILNMAVYRLSNMELQAILDEVKGLQKRVKELMAFTKTKSNALVDKYMIDEMSSMKDGVFKSYKRRTKIQSNYEHISNDEIVRDEPVSLVLTQNGYIKKFAGHSVTMDMNPVSLGVTSDDEVVDIIRTSEAKTICVVTDRSHVFGFKVHSLDFNKRGKLLRNVVLAKDYENVLDWWEYDSNTPQSILTLSEEGMIKSTAIETNMLTNNGKLIMDVGRKGKLVGVALLDKNSPDTVVVATQGGQLLRFKNNIRNTGIGGIGVKAIKLKENDSCCGLAVSKSNVSIVSNHGNVKTINLNDIPCSDNRGGFGVIGYNSKDDHLIAIVNDEVGRYVCRTGNNILYEFSNNKPTKRTNKPISLNIPSNFTINRVSKWR